MNPKMPIAAFLLSALIPPLLAQEVPEEETPAAAGSEAVLHTDELALESYAVESEQGQQVFRLARDFLGRKILVRSTLDEEPRSVFNLSWLGDTVLIYDEPAYVEQVVDLLAKVDREIQVQDRRRQEKAKAEQTAALEVLEYAPRFVSLATLQSLLKPFERDVENPDGETFFRNTSYAHDTGRLLVRDLPERLAEMRDVVEEADRPRPQVMLTVHLVTVGEDAGGGELPMELVENLSRLVGRDSFELVATGRVRTSVLPSRQVRIRLESEVSLHELTATLAAYDGETGTLTLSGCVLTARGSGELFETACSVRTGEYTVLGSSGARPVFAVLRVEDLGA